MSPRRSLRLSLSPAPPWVPVLLLLMLLLAAGPGVGSRVMVQAPAPAEKDADKPAEKEAQKPAPLALAESVAYRVYQRDRTNRADIPIVFNSEVTILDVSAVGSVLPTNIAPAPRGVTILRVPVGGPYTFNIGVGRGANVSPNTPNAQFQRFQVGPLFVGDLWLLAGQSNMEGLGNLEDVTPPSDRVTLLGMDGHWRRAEEPLHWLVDSPDPVHSGDPATRAKRSEEQHQKRVKGAGLGLPFGVTLSNATGVPIGLIATAHGGTSMKQWDPALKDEGGKSLYGSMLGQVRRAGGRVRGVLWYQGESDANPEAAREYPRVFASFIGSVREDLGDLDLPFYLVQIGRFIRGGDPAPWNAVQDAQRRIPDRVANTAVVASVDLELDDGIHVATPGLKRLGTRLARIAERELYGMAGATTPTFERVNRRGDRTLVVKFKGVNREARASQPGAAPAPMFSGLGQPIPVPGGPGFAAAGGPTVAGLQPSRHIAGFSIRKDDGTEVPLIYDAAVGPSQDTVILRLSNKVPEGASLWYGHGYDPYCNLTDALDMAVPVFGPIALDDVE